MSHWKWVLGEAAPSTVETRQLTAATGRKVTFRLDAGAEASFSIRGEHPEALEVDELATDLHCLRDGTRLFRGRIAPETDTISETSHSVAFTAWDYRLMLGTRWTPKQGLKYTAVDQASIAWQLVNTSQGRPAGDWGITQGLGSTSGTTRTREVDPGKPILQELESLARLNNGFEWQISPDLELDRWYPERGADNGVVIDWGGRAKSATRTLDPAGFGNAVLVTGADTTSPVVETTTDIATDDRGRWEITQSYPNIKRQTTLDARALWLVDQTSTIRPAWKVDLHPGRWEGPDHLWIGDTIRWVCKSGRLAVNSLHRVAELAVDIDDNDTEQVSLGLLPALEGSS